jgi:hypothetical protein
MSIQRLDAQHADAAAATLGDAFFGDPLLQIAALDEATRRRWGFVVHEPGVAIRAAMGEGLGHRRRVGRSRLGAARQR